MIPISAFAKGAGYKRKLLKNKSSTLVNFDFWAKFVLLGNAEFTKRPLLR